MMARKPKLKPRVTSLAKLEVQAKKLEAEKRWLALRAFWLQVSRDIHHNDLWSLYRMRADAAKAHFETVCVATSEIIHTPTPRRCPFHSYDVYQNRKRMNGVQPTARRAVQVAQVYKKEVVVTGITLNGERHTVLIVNVHGEVTFVHPQFKVKLSESGGVA